MRSIAGLLVKATPRSLSDSEMAQNVLFESAAQIRHTLLVVLCYSDGS